MRIVAGFKLRNIMGQAAVIGEGVGQVGFDKLITLNHSAAYLWRNIESREFDVQLLAELLVSEYEVPYDVALKDAQIVAQGWLELGIVEQ